jgi:hypothetical protein
MCCWLYVHCQTAVASNSLGRDENPPSLTMDRERATASIAIELRAKDFAL